MGTDWIARSQGLALLEYLDMGKPISDAFEGYANKTAVQFFV